MSNNTAQVGVRFSVQDAELVKRALAQIGDEGQRTLAKLERATQGPSQGFVALNAASQEAQASIAGLTGRLGPLGAALGALGPAGIAAVMGITAATAGLSKAYAEASQGEVEIAKIGAVIRATGGAALKTAEDIDRLAESIAGSTLETEGDVKRALTQLLTFGNISGQVFDRAAVLAADLSTVFGSLSSATSALGKALQDPADGMDALRRAGVTLNAETKERIKLLSEEGRLTEAQTILLDALTAKVGGVGAAAGDTAVGAMHHLSEATNNYFENLGNALGVLSTAKDMIQALTEKIGFLSGALTDDGKITDLIVAAGNARPGTRAEQAANGNAAQLQALLASRRATQAAAADRAWDASKQQELNQLESAYADEIKKTTTALLENAAAALERGQKSFEEAQKLIAFNKKADEQDAAAHAKSLEVRERSERVFAYDMINLRLELMERLESEGVAPENFLVADSDAIRRFDEQQQEAADKIKAINDEAARDVFDLWRDGWEDMLSGNLDSFKDFAGKIENIATRLFANKMAAKTESYLTDLLGESGLESLSAGITGYQFGSRLGNARKGPGNEIGGAIGGTIGSMWGPMGTFAGSAIGSLLGGQFGARPSDQIEAVTRLFNPDGSMTRTEQDLGRGKDSPENRAAVNAFDNAVMEFVGALKSANLNPQTWAYTLSAGGGNSLAPFMASVNNSGEKGFQSADEAFKWVADQLVSTISDVPERLQQLVDNFDPSNIEDFLNGLTDFQAFQGSMQGVNDELLRRRDPKAYEIAMLDRQFDPLKNSLMATGEDLKAINELYGLILSDITKKYEDPVTGRDNAAWGASMGGLRDELAQVRDPAGFQLRKLDEWRAQMRDAAQGNQEDLLLIEEVYGQRRANIVEEGLRATQARIADMIADAARTQADIVRGSIDTQRDLASFMRSSGRGYRDALFNMSIDPKSALPMDRLSILQSEFDKLRPQAMLGNRDAMERLLDIGQQYEDVAQEVFGSNSEFIAIQERVRDTFSNVADLADRQASIAEQQLGVLELQLAELQRIAGGASGLVQGNASPKFTTTSQDFASVNAAWVAAGMPAPGTASNAAFENVVRGLIDNAGADQTGYLTDMLRFQSGLLNDPVQGGIASRYSGDIIRQFGDILSSGTATSEQTAAIVTALNGVAASNTVLSNDIRDVLARVA